MSRIARLVVLASVLAFARGQAPAALDPCAQKCVDSVKGSGAAVGCNGGEPSCMCAKPDFAFGVRDCAKQACAPDIVAQATNFVSSLCATATLATVTTSSTSPPVAAAPAVTSTSTNRPTPSSAPQATAVSSTTSTTSTTASASASASTQPNSSASTTTSAAKASNSATKDKDDKDDEPVGGLTVGAKAGIGITVALVGTGLIGLAFWLLRRSRSRNSINTGDFHISGPMPGSGRDYADSHLDYNKENNTSELELRSRRYEDMLPRQQPASMI